MLTETTIKELARLEYQPDAEWLVNVFPFGSVYWADEMPDIGKLVHCQGQDWKEILRMFSIRLKVWDGEVLSSDETQLWDSLHNQVPAWPLFQRLNLSDEQKRARQKAERRVAEEIEILCDEANEK